mgnify:FL=1
MKTQSYPLLDVFAEELDKSNRAKQEETAIHTLRMLMKSPYAAEYLNSLLLNFLGCPTPIKSKTIDDAIDFLIESNEICINQSIQDESKKEAAKAGMKAALNTDREMIKDFLKGRELLR